MKVGVLHSLIMFFILFMHKALCCACIACMCVEFAWEGFKHVSWMSFLCFALNFEGIVWGCFGIAHPWIGKKWPCTGDGP